MGNNIELLKKELLAQKEVIESMGGYVNVANNNPSPSEITEGIKTVSASSVDLSLATATVTDVKAGKTFYAGTNELKTGTKSDEEYINLFIYGICDQDQLTTPDDLKRIRPYCFTGMVYNTTFVLNKNVEAIGEYSFENNAFSDFDFNNSTNLKTIERYAFQSSELPINLSRIPDSVETLGDRPFYQSPCVHDGYLKIPRNLTTSYTYPLTNGNQVTYPDGLNWNYNTTWSVVTQYAFYQSVFGGEFTLPSCVTEIQGSAFINALFTKFNIPSTFKTFAGNFFGVTSGYISKVEDCSVIFESITPPTFKSRPFFNMTNIETFRIYVPDESYEDYCAISNLANYLSKIKRMSELPE